MASALQEDRLLGGNGSVPRFLDDFICRCGGVSHLEARSALSDELETHLAECAANDHRARELAEALSADIHVHIGREADRVKRNELLAARRKLFNGKRPTQTEVETVRKSLEADALLRFEELLTILGGREHDEAKTETLYRSTLTADREQFRRVIADPDFQAALALSSDSLFANLQTYLRTDVAVSNSRTEQVERGLYRYLTRMATKATPFSRFCSIIPGRLETAPESLGAPAISLRGEIAKKNSIVRANKQILAQLWEKLRTIPEFRAAMRVGINPTVSCIDERVVFLASEGSREVFRRVPRSDELWATVEMSRERPRFAQLTAAIAQDERFDASVEEAIAYVEQLVAIGLLHLESIVRDQEADWLPTFSAFIEPIVSPATDSIVRCLNALRRAVETFGGLTGSQRASMLRELRASLADAYDVLGIPRRGETDLPIYEDATGHGAAVILRTEPVERALTKLAEWVVLMAPLANARSEQATMRHFYESQYDAATAEAGVPLLGFYEDYYRQHFKQHLEHVAASRQGKTPAGYDVNNPFKLREVAAIQRAGAALLQSVGRRWNAAGDIGAVHLRRADVEHALADVQLVDTTQSRSFNLFMQLVEYDDGRVLCVLPTGNVAPGYGKFFSRFLHILPPEIQERIVERNAFGGTVAVAEICSDGAFNANLHPKLLPFEIRYPTSQDPTHDAQISTDKIRVVRDPLDGAALRLQSDSDGVILAPVDLGFLSPQRRPPLYQLLTHFSPVRFFSLQMPFQPLPAVSAATSAERAEERVRRRPRVTYEETIVLAREGWHVPQAHVPVPTKGETPQAFYLRVDRWRRAHSLPRIVYVRVLPLEAGAGMAKAEATPQPKEPEAHEADAEPTEQVSEHSNLEDPKAPTSSAESKQATRYIKPSRDYRKPQYIDFQSPFSILLFAKLTVGLKRFSMTIDECLPDYPELLVCDSLPYSTEFIMQIDIRLPEGRA